MKTLLLLLSIFFLCQINAQTPDVTWQKTIGGNLSDELNTVVLTIDGGYLLGGTSESGISGEKADSSKGGKDYWIVRLDSSRNILWQKTIGGSSTDELKQIVISNDGGYLLGGYSSSNISFDKTEDAIGSYDYWVVKIDSVGNIEWDKTIGGIENDQLMDMVSLSDYGYVLAGNSSSNSSGHKTEDSEGYQDFWIVMIDSLGEIEWQNTIGGDSTDALYSIEKTTDNGFILGGDSRSNISGDKLSPLGGSWDFWVVKINEFGGYEWDRNIGVPVNSAWAVAFETADGGYQISGTSGTMASGIKSEDSPGGIAYWVVKLDADGGLVWENSIGGSDFDYLSTAIPTLDGGSLLAGYSSSPASIDKTEDSYSTSYWVVKLDSEGIIEWDNTIGGNSGDYPTTLLQLSENEYIIGGRSKSKSFLDKVDPTRGDNDYWILKLGICEDIDNSVTEHSSGWIVWDLEANASGYEYLWYECYYNYRVPIAGKTGQRLEVPYYTIGDYSVRVSSGDCAVFSDCYHVYHYGLDVDDNEINKIKVYPNPTSDILNVEFDQPLKTVISNSQGKTVLTSDKSKISISHLDRGTYIVKIYDKDSNLVGVESVIKS